MTLAELDNEILFLDNLIPNQRLLFDTIAKKVIWDDSMKSRKTSSFGIPYDYSNMNYNYIEIPDFIQEIILLFSSKIPFVPNNCLINYYFETSSSMGYHSDRTDILESNTGICIISLGNERILRFRNKSNKELTKDLILGAGSLFLMSQLVQEHWEHAILKSSNVSSERISLTFRKIRSDYER